jgi:hypothetical protein
MEITAFPPQALARCELEEIWRCQLEKSHARYKAATQCYCMLIQQELDGHRLVPDNALARAREVKSHALKEYFEYPGRIVFLEI